MLINIADLRDPDDPQGRSYRQVNAEKHHAIPIGTLVQLENGARAFVVFHGRDCDQTPLYYLSLDEDDTEEMRPGWRNPSWIGGYSDDGLVVVRVALDDTPPAVVD